MPHAVCALIQNPDNPDFYLGICKRGRANDWGLIGGKLDLYEGLVDGMIREVREETGIEVNRANASLIYSADNREYRVHTLSVKLFEMPEIKQSDEGEVKWVSREELESSPSYGEYNQGLFEEFDAKKLWAKIDELEDLLENLVHARAMKILEDAIEATKGSVIE